MSAGQNVRAERELPSLRSVEATPRPPPPCRRSCRRRQSGPLRPRMRSNRRLCVAGERDVHRARGVHADGVVTEPAGVNVRLKGRHDLVSGRAHVLEHTVLMEQCPEPVEVALLVQRVGGLDQAAHIRSVSIRYPSPRRRRAVPSGAPSRRHPAAACARSDGRGSDCSAARAPRSPDGLALTPLLTIRPAVRPTSVRRVTRRRLGGRHRWMTHGCTGSAVACWRTPSSLTITPRGRPSNRSGPRRPTPRPLVALGAECSMVNAPPSRRAIGKAGFRRCLPERLVAQCAGGVPSSRSLARAVMLSAALWPGRPVRLSLASSVRAALINDRWVKACGKFPICSPLTAISSE